MNLKNGCWNASLEVSWDSFLFLVPRQFSKCGPPSATVSSQGEAVTPVRLVDGDVVHKLPSLEHLLGVVDPRR